MKILVVGSGGMGGYYGGLLSNHGHEVTFMARGEHLKAIQTNGLEIHSIHGDLRVAPARATDQPESAGSPELVLICVKTYHTDEAVERIRPVIGESTTVLSLQNGVEAPERIGGVIGMGHMLGGATWISSAIEAPGVIRQMSQFRRVALGELDGRVSERSKAIHKAFEETGVTAELPENILRVMWSKFVFIAAASSFGSLTRVPIGQYRSVPETRALVVQLLNEVAAVAERHGIGLGQDIVEKTLAFIDNNGPAIKPSMQLDVEAGRRTEMESLIGAVRRKGDEAGVDTPMADALYALLLPADLQARNR